MTFFAPCHTVAACCRLTPLLHLPSSVLFAPIWTREHSQTVAPDFPIRVIHARPIFVSKIQINFYARVYRLYRSHTFRHNPSIPPRTPFQSHACSPLHPVLYQIPHTYNINRILATPLPQNATWSAASLPRRARACRLFPSSAPVPRFVQE